MAPIIYPRSPREVMEGWVHLPRFIDKIRLFFAGKLAPEYQGNFAHKGFDAKFLEAAGLSAEKFIEFVQSTITDGEVADWIRKNVKKSGAEKAAFKEGVFNFGKEGEEAKARLIMRKKESGLENRDDIQCFVDYIDADEGRLLGAPITLQLKPAPL